MKVRLHVLAATMALAGLFSAPMSANALGFGAIRLNSEIGQPLNAEVDLKLSDREAIEDIVVRHATVPDYERQGITYTSTVNGLQVKLEVRGGKPVAIVRTVGPVREPVLNFILNSESVQGKMSRAFTLPIKTSALAGPSAEVGSRTSLAVTTAEAVREASALGSVPKGFNEKTGLWDGEDTRLYDFVIEVGQRPGAKDLARIKGFGKDVPLVEVFSKVVPKGWKGFAGDVSMKTAKPVDWVGASRYWITILDEHLGKAGMTATVDWTRKEVTFRSVDVASVATAAPATVAEATPTPAVAPVVVASAPVAVPTSDADAARVAEERAQKARAERLAETRAAAAQQAEAERSRVAKLDADAAKRQAVADEAVVAKAAADKDAAEKAALAKADAERTQAQAARDAAEHVAVSKRESDARAAADRQATATAQAEAVRQSEATAAAARAAEVDRAAAVAANTKAQADEKAKNQQLLASLKNVEVFGEVPAEAFDTRTAGFNVGLFSAVQRILPPGYSLFTQDESLNTVADVSWRGGNRNWLVVLNETVASKGLRAIVNPVRKEVFLKR